MRLGCNPTCAQAATPRAPRLQPYISRPSESYQAEMDQTVRQSDLQTAAREERQRRQRQERRQALWRMAQVTMAQEQKVAGERRSAEERAAAGAPVVPVQAQQRAGLQPAQQVVGLQAQPYMARLQAAQAQRERLQVMELAQREQGGQRRAAEVDEAVDLSDQPPPQPPPPPGEGVFRSLGVSAATQEAGLTAEGQRSFDLAVEMSPPLAELRLERRRLQMQQQRHRASLAGQAGHAGPQPADPERGHGDQHEQQHEQQPQQTLAQQGLARPSRLAAINATRMLMAMEGAVVRLGPRHQATVPPWTGGDDARTAAPPARRDPISPLYLPMSPYISLYLRQHGAPPDRTGRGCSPTRCRLQPFAPEAAPLSVQSAAPHAQRLQPHPACAGAWLRWSTWRMRRTT